MEETIRKLYAVTGDAKSKVGNTPMGHGVAALCDAETPAVACGFLDVSSWFPHSLKSFLIGV